MITSYVMLLVGLVTSASMVHSMWKERALFMPVFRNVVREMRWYMPLEILPVQVLVVAFGGLLAYCIPFTRHGWLYLLAGTPGDTNANFALAQVSPVWIAVPFLLLTMLYMPSLALSEEKSFRKGCGKNDILLVVQAFFFGPVHWIAGVPIAFGLALIGAGLFFGWKFRQVFRSRVKMLPEGTSFVLNGQRMRVQTGTYILGDEVAAETAALHVSAAYHTIWNWMLVALLAVTLLVSFLAA